MKKQILLGALIVVAALQIGEAQSVRNSAEAIDNQKSITLGKEQLETDIAQLAAFKTKVDAFEQAFINKNQAKVKALKKDLLTDMRREIEQSERKIAQDQKELTKSKAEVNSSNREVRRSRRDAVTADGDIGDGRDLRDDRRDKRDDQRDAKDDKADLERQIARTAQQKKILTTLEAYTFTFEASAQERAMANKRLLNDFVTTMEADIAATKAELAEDQAEKREDSRERREDRREVRERRRGRG